MKGLSFSEQMVKAWMEGRKSVTRRLIDVPADSKPEFIHFNDTIIDFVHFYGDSADKIIKPRYTPGETVYVKETWAAINIGYDFESGGYVDSIEGCDPELVHKWMQSDRYNPNDKQPPFDITYRARDEWEGDKEERGFSWKSPRFMPEWASRSHARIVSVRAERVQEITEEEVKREGVELSDWALTPDGNQSGPATAGFAQLWDKLHPGTWDQNPWIWRIELEKLP